MLRVKMIAPTMLVAAAAAETSSTSAWAPMWNITRPESVTDASGKTTARSASPVSCSLTEGSMRSRTASGDADDQRRGADDDGQGDHGVNR